MSERKQGTVKWFNTEKGYGFILNPEGEDVFVHYRSIQIEGFKNLREGQEVSFLQIKSEKGWQAAEVEVDDLGYSDEPRQASPDQTSSDDAMEANPDVESEG